MGKVRLLEPRPNLLFLDHQRTQSFLCQQTVKWRKNKIFVILELPKHRLEAGGRSKAAEIGNDIKLRYSQGLYYYNIILPTSPFQTTTD